MQDGMSRIRFSMPSRPTAAHEQRVPPVCDPDDRRCERPGVSRLSRLVAAVNGTVQMTNERPLRGCQGPKSHGKEPNKEKQDSAVRDEPRRLR